MDSNCNTGMTTHTARLLLLLLDQTRASSAMLILIGRLFAFQFCIFTTLSTQNKNGALNKSYFQRKWSKNNKIEKRSQGPRLGPRFPAPINFWRSPVISHVCSLYMRCSPLFRLIHRKIKPLPKKCFFLLFTFANGLGKTHKSIFSRKAAFGRFLHTPDLPSPKQPCIY